MSPPAGGRVPPPSGPQAPEPSLPFGCTLVEVIVATALLTVVALGLTTTLVGAQRGRALSERSMRATQLAADAIERLRAGQRTFDPPPSGFERRARVTPWSDHADLDLLEVQVSWNDGAPHNFQLVTLARRGG